MPAVVIAAGARRLLPGPSAEPVTDDYPGEGPPDAFTGGTLHRIAVDVSGEPYLDLAGPMRPEMLIRSQ